MKIVCIGFLALGIALAVLATGGIAALLLSSANLPLVSFSAVIFALAFSTLAGMIGIIGLVRGAGPTVTCSNGKTHLGRLARQRAASVSTSDLCRAATGVPAGALADMADMAATLPLA